MAIIFNGKNQKIIKFNDIDQKLVVFNGKTIWAKPFTLKSISYDAGISSIRVYRSKSYEPTASVNSTLSVNSEIYYNDILQISATPKSDYTLMSGIGSVGVKNDLSINIVSNYTKVLAPVVTAKSTNGVSCEVAINNKNPYSITCRMTIYYRDDDGSNREEYYGTTVVPALTDKTITVSYESGIIRTDEGSMIFEAIANSKEDANKQTISIPRKEETTTTTTE